ncbi:hypothetical protein YC2023_092169 [Brassica napus]
MADSLSMSLDEMVKRSKAAKKSAGKGVSRGGAKGAGRGAGGPVRRGPLAVKARPSSFSNKASSRIWDLLSWSIWPSMMISTGLDEQKFLDEFITRCTFSGGALLVHLGSSGLMTFVVVGGGVSANLDSLSLKLRKFMFCLWLHLEFRWSLMAVSVYDSPRTMFLASETVIAPVRFLNRRKKNLPWQNGLFEESMRSVGVTGIEVGTTVYVTNLDQGVTNEDIRELFGEIGEMKRYAIHYDQNGRPNGSAEVVYMRRSDAFQAMKRYNNVLLDGRSMKLEILGGNNEVAPVAARVNVTGLNGRMKRTVSVGQGIRGGRGRGRSAAPSVRRLPIGNQQGGGVRSGRGGFRGRGRGQAGGGRGNKGGRGGKKAVEKSAEELDKDLETYHAEAMNIS